MYTAASAAPAARPAPPPQEFAQGPSSLVPTVRYRGRQTDVDEDRVSSTGQATVPFAEDQALSDQLEAQAELASLANPAPSVQAPPALEVAEQQADPAPGAPAAAPETSETRPPNRPKTPGHWQWHHRASTALGFHPPKRSLSKATTVALAAVAVLALIAIPVAIIGLTGGFKPQTQAVEQSAEPSVPAPGASGATEWSVGRDFESGDFTLQVVSYEDSLTALSGDNGVIPENGQWVLVEVAVENRGSKEGTFIPDQQKLVTDTGETYDNEPGSALMHAQFNLGSTPIKPGQTQTGFLAFDIPIDSRAARLTLVGRIGGEPVTVPLG